MNIRRTTVDEVYNAPNLEDLLNMYSEESRGKGLPDVNPDWEMYRKLESIEFLDIIGVYKDELLVGLAVVINSILPHYSTRACTIESIFVMKEYRKYGAGIKLLKEVEVVARERQALQLFLSAPFNGTLDKVAGRLGFNKTNTIYTRHII